MRPAALGAALLLAGCGHFRAQAEPGSGARPVLRADSGGSAVLLVIACPPTEGRAMAIGELLQMITNHEELLVARDGGSVRMTINGCPFGPVVPPPGSLQARRG